MDVAAAESGVVLADVVAGAAKVKGTKASSAATLIWVEGILRSCTQEDESRSAG